jgi:hypothetical protein
MVRQNKWDIPSIHRYNTSKISKITLPVLLGSVLP